MSNEFQELKRDYRDIKAPPHLATRVHGAVSEAKRRGYNWLPAAATVMAVIAVAWVVPLLLQQQTAEPPKPIKPSLSTMAALKPEKPAGTTISLSRVRSVAVPAMPNRPEPVKPQSKLLPINDLSEEKDHAFI